MPSARIIFLKKKNLYFEIKYFLAANRFSAVPQVLNSKIK